MPSAVQGTVQGSPSRGADNGAGLDTDEGSRCRARPSREHQGWRERTRGDAGEGAGGRERADERPWVGAGSGPPGPTGSPWLEWGAGLGSQLPASGLVSLWPLVMGSLIPTTAHPMRTVAGETETPAHPGQDIKGTPAAPTPAPVPCPACILSVDLEQVWGPRVVVPLTVLGAGWRREGHLAAQPPCQPVLPRPRPAWWRHGDLPHADGAGQACRSCQPRSSRTAVADDRATLVPSAKAHGSEEAFGGGGDKERGREGDGASTLSVSSLESARPAGGLCQDWEATNQACPSTWTAATSQRGGLCRVLLGHVALPHEGAESPRQGHACRRASAL